MPVYRNRTVLEIARGLRAFLNLDAGLVRGAVPNPEQSREQLEQTRSRVEQLRERLSDKDRQLERMRERLSEKDQRVAALQAEGATHSLSQPPEDVPVFFLIGQGRSGTSWLQTILNSHPEILCKGEGNFFDRNFRREDFREHPGLVPSSLYNAITESEYLRMWVERSVWVAHEDAEEHLDNLTGLAVNYFLTRDLAKTGKRIVGDKTPFITVPDSGPWVLKEIARILPEAKVIHIIRDGRDVAVSVMHFYWNSPKSEGGIYELGPELLRKRDAYRKEPSSFTESLFTEQALAAISGSWRTEVEKALEEANKLGWDASGDSYTEVRYEDLLKRPHEEVRRLLEFLGANASEEIVRKCVEATGFEQLSGRKRGQEDSTSGAFRKGVAGDWRSVFTEGDKRIFKESAGDLLIKLGYEKDRDW